MTVKDTWTRDAVRGWSEAKLKAWNGRKINPNEYLYRFPAPGVEQATGPFTVEEQRLLDERVAEFKQQGWPLSSWGLFSLAIPGRVGYQCAAQYRKGAGGGQNAPRATAADSAFCLAHHAAQLEQIWSGSRAQRVITQVEQWLTERAQEAETQPSKLQQGGPGNSSEGRAGPSAPRGPLSAPVCAGGRAEVAGLPGPPIAVQWSSDSEDSDSDFERPASKAPRAAAAQGSAPAGSRSLAQTKQQQQQQQQRGQASASHPRAPCQGPSALPKQQGSGADASAAGAVAPAAAGGIGAGGGQAANRLPPVPQDQPAQPQQQPWAACFQGAAAAGGLERGLSGSQPARPPAAAAAAQSGSQQGGKLSLASAAQGGDSAGVRSGRGRAAQKAKVSAVPSGDSAGMCSGLGPAAQKAMAPAAQGGDSAAAQKANVLAGPLQRPGFRKPGMPAKKPSVLVTNVKGTSSRASIDPGAEGGSDDEFVAGSLRQAPPPHPLPGPSDEISCNVKAAKPKAASGKRKRMWKSQDGKAVADGWEASGGDASEGQVTLIKLQPQGIASWPGWPRAVAPYGPLPSPAAAQQAMPALAAGGDGMMPGDAVGWGAVARGGPFQGVLVSPGWWEEKEGEEASSDPVQCLSKVPLPQLAPTGFLFIWVPKQLIHNTCSLMSKWGYTLVENLTWVYLAPSGSTLQLPSPLVCRSHLTLFIFRKEGEGKDIQLRHQRTPDVITDCVAQAPGGSEAGPAEAFTAIETLLPTGKGRFLELWAPQGTRRPGWTHLVKRGGGLC